MEIFQKNKFQIFILALQDISNNNTSISRRNALNKLQIFPNLSSSVLFSLAAPIEQNPLKHKKKLVIMMALHKEDEHREPKAPSWEVLCLVGSYMKPETLAVASCVSTTWLKCFSSEDLWKSMLTAHDEPFNFAATTVETMPKLPYKRLVSAAESDAKRRRKNKPAEPKISLSDLVFIIHLSSGSTQATVVKQGKDLVFDSNEKFQIEANISDSRFTADMKEVRMLWKVVFKDYQSMFTISDTVVKSLDTKIGWFTDELPAPENSYSPGSNLVGDFKPSFNGEVLDKVVLAMTVSCDWKSLSVDDVLRYLQCFLVN